MSEDFYKVLGVDKQASTEDIKKAYKKLAIKWHPDKNPQNKEQATEKFKKIAEAYETLSDPNKRQQYDNFGTNNPQMQFQQQRGNFNDFDMGGFGGFGFQQQRGGQSGRFGHNDFTFERAEQIFRDMFNEFDSFDSRQQKSSQRQQNFSGMHDDDDDFFGNDPFFGGGMKLGGGFGRNLFQNFGMGGGFGNMSSMSQMMSQGGGGGFSSSVSTSTIIKNGKRVTVTKKTVTNPDGTQTTEVHEQVDDGVNNSQNRYLQNNNQQSSRMQQIQGKKY